MRGGLFEERRGVTQLFQIVEPFGGIAPLECCFGGVLVHQFEYITGDETRIGFFDHCLAGTNVFGDGKGVNAVVKRFGNEFVAEAH